MARPIAGDPPAGSPPAPYPTASGVPAPAAPSPFSYTNQPNMPGPTVSGTPTPSGLWNAFRRRWVLCTFVGALVAAIVAVGAWLMMPAGKHQARALVQVQPQQIQLVNKDSTHARSMQQHQYQLRGRDLFTRVLADPAVSSLDMVKASDDPVQMIEDSIKVTVATPEILEVTLTGNHLDDMKVFLDYLVKRHVAEANASDNKETQDQMSSLEKLRTTVEQEIGLMEKAIEMASRNNGVTGAESAASPLQLLHIRHGETERLLVTTARALDLMEAERKVLKKQLEEIDPKAPLDKDRALIDLKVANDPRVAAARDTWKKFHDFYQDELKKSNPENAYIKELAEKDAKLKQELTAAEKVATSEIEVWLRAKQVADKQERLAKLNTDIEVKQEERLSISKERDAVKRAIENTAGHGSNIEAMRKAIEPQREMLTKVQTQLMQVRLQGDKSRVSPRGEVETIRNNNQNKKIALSSVGGIGSFVAVVLLISFLEWRTRRVDGVDQVVTELGMRVIGTVPVFPNRASIQAAVEAGGANWRFVLNESINSTRTMLLHTAKSQSMQVVMVTSATQGEGKTSLSSQLATSMATAGMRTLIVDCDLRNPCIMKLFELPLTPGVSEILRQEVDVSDAVQATAVPNLWVIPAGQCSNATIAALAQGHPLETLFNRLRGQFDFVIVDSCPVLPVADALLIAQHVDGVVFSIMQDISQLPKVMTASEKLTQLNIPLVGAVVNGIKQDVYSYGYNYVKQLPA